MRLREVSFLPKIWVSTDGIDWEFEPRSACLYAVSHHIATQKSKTIFVENIGWFSFPIYHSIQNTDRSKCFWPAFWWAAFPIWRLGGYKLRPGSRKTFKTLFINYVGYLFRSEWCLGSPLRMLFHIKVAHPSLLNCQIVVGLGEPLMVLMCFLASQDLNIGFLFYKLCSLIFLGIGLRDLVLDRSRWCLPVMCFKLEIRITLDSCWKFLNLLPEAGVLETLKLLCWGVGKWKLDWDLQYFRAGLPRKKLRPGNVLTHTAELGLEPWHCR